MIGWIFNELENALSLIVSLTYISKMSHYYEIIYRQLKIVSKRTKDENPRSTWSNSNFGGQKIVLTIKPIVTFSQSIPKSS